jgi:sarcosine oxidase subunit alpha
VVAHYSSARQEAEAAQTGLGVADISAIAKLRFRGPGVAAFTKALVPGSAALQPRGVAVVPGGTETACRLTENHLLILSSTPAAPLLDERIPHPREGEPVIPTDVTSAYASFYLIGSQLEPLMRRLTALDIRQDFLPVNSCAETAVAGVDALLVRSGEIALPALRLYVAWDVGEYVWESLLETGREIPITPLGLEAMAVLGAVPSMPGVVKSQQL